MLKSGIWIFIYQIVKIKDEIKLKELKKFPFILLDASEAVKIAQNKYKDFNKDQDIQKCVNIFIKDIYNKKKDDTISNYNTINKCLDIKAPPLSATEYTKRKSSQLFNALTGNIAKLSNYGGKKSTKNRLRKKGRKVTKRRKTVKRRKHSKK